MPLHDHPICEVCRRTPEQIPEYVEAAREYNDAIDPDTYVRAEDGTWNPEEDAFFCTGCYILIGMPLNTDRAARRPLPAPEA